MKLCLDLCPSDLRNTTATSQALQVQMRPFVIAWMFYAILYFLEYAIRSLPAVTIPELAQLFGASSVSVWRTHLFSVPFLM